MRYSICFTFTALLLVACEGTETDNPLVDFKRTSCKNHGDTALTFASDTQASEPLPESSEYDGFYCFAYEHDPETKLLEIDVYNYPSSCGSEFTGASVTSREGWLTLYMQRASCDVARCGTCYYDLSFKVADVELSGAHMIELAEAGCEGTPAEHEAEVLFFNTGAQQNAGTSTFCRTLGEPAACESDDDCHADLEQCDGDGGVCELLLTF